MKRFFANIIRPSKADVTNTNCCKTISISEAFTRMEFIAAFKGETCVHAPWIDIAAQH
jgi:hypothetical protein